MLFGPERALSKLIHSSWSFLSVSSSPSVPASLSSNSQRDPSGRFPSVHDWLRVTGRPRVNVCRSIRSQRQAQIRSLARHGSRDLGTSGKRQDVCLCGSRNQCSVFILRSGQAWDCGRSPTGWYVTSCCSQGDTYGQTRRVACRLREYLKLQNRLFDLQLVRSSVLAFVANARQPLLEMPYGEYTICESLHRPK